MNKKNGFTLIELLAVIVILAVIALIVTPMVMNTINSAREGAAKSSGYEFIHDIETKLAVVAISGNGYTGTVSAKYDTTTVAAATLNVAKGVVTAPTVTFSVDWTDLANHTNNIDGTVYVNGITVASADLAITNGTVYNFKYDGKTLTAK